MGLVRVWRERKRVSPHRAKRASTVWLVVALVFVILLFYLLGRVA